MGAIQRVAPEALAAALPGATLVWWHASERPHLTDASALLEWLMAGGRLWLTLQAVALLPQLGLEGREPDLLGMFAWRHPAGELTALEGERRGLAGFGPHPTFEGLHGGVLLLRPRAGESYPEAVYTTRPRGQVIAAEWQYLGIDARRRLALEHTVGQGRVLSVGAHLLFAPEDNPYRRFLERFARDCLDYLASPIAAHPNRYWPATDSALADTLDLGAIRPPQGDESAAEPSSELGCLTSDGRGDAQFDVVGRRVLAVGRQRTGVVEVWSLPVRLASNVSATFGPHFTEGSTLTRFRVSPSHVERTFTLPEATVVQTVRAGADELHVSYEVTAGRLDRLSLAFDVDLRWFWPYPEGVLGPPRIVQEGHILRLLDGAGAMRGVVAFHARPDDLSVSADRHVHVEARFREPRRATVTFRGAWQAQPRDSAHDDGPLPRVETPHADGPLLQVETPDAVFDQQLAWAVDGLRGFDVESPAGRGLVAGMAETGTGWWSGRLGYAWYFGRDSMWSSMGCLGAGLREPVRETLRLLARYQQLDGKILHELTPAGMAHFDAADSTPLFLVGLDRYLR